MPAIVDAVYRYADGDVGEFDAGAGARGIKAVVG